LYCIDQNENDNDLTDRLSSYSGETQAYEVPGNLSQPTVSQPAVISQQPIVLPSVPVQQNIGRPVRVKRVPARLQDSVVYGVVD
jgi:hypothetical protein